MDLGLQIRRPDLTLWGEVPAEALLSFEADLVFRKLGTWKVTLPAGMENNPDDGLNAATALASPGWGIVATNAIGGVLLSGPTSEATFTQAIGDPDGTWEISGEDDSVVLSDMLAYPSPGTLDLAAQTGTATTGYDARTGHAETVIRAYVDANTGPSAPTGRELPALTLAADAVTGTTVTGQGRFQQLGELAETLSQAGGGGGFRIVWTNGALQLQPYQPRDLTGLIRLDVANGTLRSVTYTVRRPDITRAIVGGAVTDEPADRALLEVTTTESLAAEALWGYGGRDRRIERFIDGNTDEPDELAQAGVEALADGGRTITSLTVEPVDTDDVQLGRDYWLGDRVTIVVGAGEIPDVVAGAQITLDPSGFTATAVLGDPDTAIRDVLVRNLTTARARAQRRISRLERR